MVAQARTPGANDTGIASTRFNANQHLLRRSQGDILLLPSKLLDGVTRSLGGSGAELSQRWAIDVCYQHRVIHPNTNFSSGANERLRNFFTGSVMRTRVYVAYTWSNCRHI